MLILDFANLNLKDRASYLLEYHSDMNVQLMTSLINIADLGGDIKCTIKPVLVYFIYFADLTEQEQLDAVEHGNDEESAQSANYFRMGEIVYSTDDFLYSHAGDFEGVAPISNNSALALLALNDDQALVSYIY